ncbi:MAG: hypothetical protein N4A45_11945 [Flavobacteriales bacterium]|jgi:hypothetical protein|nr:hypothetical protein [Flavobacteriales bacterium]
MRIQLKVKKRTLQTVYYLLLIFLYIYAPPFTGLPYNVAKFVLILVVLEALYLNVFSIPRLLIGQMGLYVILIIYTIIVLEMHDTIGIFRQTGPLEQIMTHLFEIIVISALLSRILQKRGYTLDHLLNLIYSAMTIQGVLVFMNFISYDIRSTLLPLIGAKAKMTGTFDWYRGLGFSLVKNYDFALFQAMSIFIFAYKVLEKNTKLSDVLKLAIIAFSVFVSGRTGSIGIAFGLMLITYKTMSRKLFIYTIQRLAISIVGLFAAYFALSAFAPAVFSSINDKVLPWAFEFIYSYLDTGEFSTASSDQLVKDHYFDIADKTMIFGDGLYYDKSGFFYKFTDAGYMRQTLYFGVIGIVLFFIIYLRMVAQTMNYSKNTYSFIVPSYFILMAITHYKGDVFSNSLILNRGFYIIAIGIVIFNSSDVYRANAEKFYANLWRQKDLKNKPPVLNENNV